LPSGFSNELLADSRVVTECIHNPNFPALTLISSLSNIHHHFTNSPKWDEFGGIRAALGDDAEIIQA
jgi:hypothetical protein